MTEATVNDGAPLELWPAEAHGELMRAADETAEANNIAPDEQAATG